MAVLFNNNKKVDFNVIKKQLIKKSICWCVITLLSTCWLSVTSKSTVLVSPNLSQETESFGTRMFLLLTPISTWVSF